MPEEKTSGSIIAFGGEHLTVSYRPAAPGALTPPDEAVLVRELEIAPGLLEFGRLVDKPAELAEFICEKPAGWAKSLKRESLLAIYDKAIDLNFTVARLYLQSRVKLVQAISKDAPSSSPSTISASASG